MPGTGQSPLNISFPEDQLQPKDATIDKGHYLFLPDEAPAKLYYIKKGRVKVASYGENRKEIIKAIAGQGDLIGVAGLLGMKQYEDYAIALEDLKVCSITLTDVRKLMESKPEIACWVMSHIGKRMQYFNKRLESLVFKDARRRIIETLLDLNSAHGDRVGLEYVVRRFITHQEIANLSATSRQTVTSVLNDLRNDRLIKFNRRRLLIQDLDKLQSLV